jgi:hypothetical protein
MKIDEYIERNNLKPITRNEYDTFVLSNRYNLKDFCDFKEGSMFYDEDDFNDGVLNMLYEIVDMPHIKTVADKFNMILDMSKGNEETCVVADEGIDKVLVSSYW